MTINFNVNNLFAAVFLIGISNFSAGANQENPDQAPEATAEEALIKHWNMPEIKRRFRDIPELEKAFIDASPENRKDGVTVGSLGKDGGNKEKIIKLAQEIADKQHSDVDSLLIAYDDKLLFESYYSRGRIDLPHPQSSTTKSYTSLAIGRAIQLGYLSMSDLDKPIVSFLKGLNSSKFAQGVEKITLHHALSMTSGLQISQEKLDEYRQKPDYYKGAKHVQALLEDTTPITNESLKFKYKGHDPYLLMQVIDAVVPGTAEDFIKNELFGKLGIVNYDWRTDQSGLPSAGSGSSMTSRNMLKLGILVMNKGKWNGEQLIPELFIKKMKKRNVQLSDTQVQDFYSGNKLTNSGYGYFWWQVDMKAGNKRYLSNSAQGGGGLTIVCIDELDLVVVITAHSRQSYLQLIAENILPAFAK